MESEQRFLPVGSWRGCCRVGGITHPLPHGALGAGLPTKSLCGREERNGVSSGAGSQDLPESPTWGPLQYSLSRPSLLGSRRFLWVQWGLGVPEQQDRASTSCLGRVEWAGTWGAEGLGRELQLGRAFQALHHIPNAWHTARMPGI